MQTTYSDVRIECDSGHLLHWRILKELQGDLKSLSKDNYERMKNVFLEHGFSSPFNVWNDGNGSYWILDGTQRFRVLSQMDKEGYEIPDQLPVVIVEADSEQKAREKLAAMASSYGEADSDSLYEYLTKSNISIEKAKSLYSFPKIQFEKMEKEFGLSVEGKCDEDDVPDSAQGEPTTKMGDLYLLGNHRLLCGDSTNMQDVERLMNGEKADMVFTDPPYGVGYKYNSHDDNVTKEEHAQFLKDLIGLSISICDRFILTPGCYNLDAVIRNSEPTHVGCWTKTNAMSPGRVTHFWTWEPILFYGKWQRKRANDVFNFPVGKQQDTGDHTCPKPMALWQDIIENFSEPKEKILDLFGGSGSTLIACEKTNRRCFMMEIDPHYCDVIVARWEKYTGKKAILERSQ